MKYIIIEAYLFLQLEEVEISMSGVQEVWEGMLNRQWINISTHICQDITFKMLERRIDLNK